MYQQQNEYVSVVLSAELFKFCNEQNLPFDQAYELSLREDLTDFQFGFLIAYARILEALIQ